MKGYRHNAKRCAVALAALLALAGCEGTALLPLTAYTLSGLSYASSGKGLADHAISAANGKDCSLLRAAQGSSICDDGPSVEIAPALAMIGSDEASAADDAAVREILARTPDFARDRMPAGEGADTADAPAAPRRDSLPFN